jgi:hypothetical protein
MTEREELLIDCCIALDLTREETKMVFRAIPTLEQREEMLTWMEQNMEKHPKPIEVIMAAGIIQARHRS